MEYRQVEVIWRDAEEQGTVGWNDLDDMIEYAKTPCTTMHSIGYVVYEDEHHIALARCIGKDQISTVEKIPLGFVTEVRDLTYRKRK